jgi:hypothetical protein
MVKNFESKGLVHPEQKEEKIMRGKIWKGKKEKKGKGEEEKKCRTVHQAPFLGSETIIYNNGYVLFIAALHCLY